MVVPYHVQILRSFLSTQLPVKLEYRFDDETTPFGNRDRLLYFFIPQEFCWSVAAERCTWFGRKQREKRNQAVPISSKTETLWSTCLELRRDDLNIQQEILRLRRVLHPRTGRKLQMHPNLLEHSIVVCWFYPRFRFVLLLWFQKRFLCMESFSYLSIMIVAVHVSIVFFLFVWSLYLALLAHWKMMSVIPIPSP